MHRFYTKIFRIWKLDAKDVDEWFNSFVGTEKAAAERAQIQIVGYVVYDDRLIVTIEVTQ